MLLQELLLLLLCGVLLVALLFLCVVLCRCRVVSLVFILFTSDGCVGWASSWLLAVADMFVISVPCELLCVV